VKEKDIRGKAEVGEKEESELARLKQELEEAKRELRALKRQNKANQIRPRKKRSPLEGKETSSDPEISPAMKQMTAAMASAFYAATVKGMVERGEPAPEKSRFSKTASKPAAAKAGQSRAFRRFLFWSMLLLAFWGIHLMVTSSYAWYWCILMVLPFCAVLQMESEQTVPLGHKETLNTRSGRVRRSLGFWLAALAAIFGVGLMIEIPADWRWFIPFLIPFLVLLPQRMKEWEKEDEEEKARKAEQKAERKARRAASPLWKALKIAFWLGVLWVAWQWIGFYIYMWVLGLAA